MTDAQKIEALTDLLTTVMHTLEMKHYEIEDPTESYKCVTEADQFHQRMLNILYSEDTSQTGTLLLVGGVFCPIITSVQNYDWITP